MILRDRSLCLSVSTGAATLRLASLALVLFALGCDRPDRSGQATAGAGAPSTSQATNSRRLPSYTFAPGVESAHPEVAVFVRSFMETCLAGDYRGYRRLVSRFDAPESEQRFKAIYQAVQRATIRSIEALPQRGEARVDYLVLSEIVFDPASNIAIRRRSREVAMLVFLEDGHWRMARAPSELQPQPDEENDVAPQSAPASGPSYPWDVEPG